MSNSRSKRGWLLVIGLLPLIALGGLVLFLSAPPTAPAGPVPIAWDKQSCAHCGMHIGEPAFAAQIQTRVGDVFDFDDPGCLFAFLGAHPELSISEIYFHHSSEDRWLSQNAVGFVKRSPTPMGYGYAAVDRQTPQALSFEAVRAALATRKRAEARGEDP